MSEPETKNLYISCAHEDLESARKILVYLAPLVASGRLRVSLADRYAPGAEDRISSQLNEADAFLILLSAEYLNSDFIFHQELPRIAQRRQTENLACWFFAVSDYLSDATMLQDLSAVSQSQAIAPFNQHGIHVPFDALESSEREVSLARQRNEILDWLGGLGGEDLSIHKDTDLRLKQKLGQQAEYELTDAVSHTHIESPAELEPDTSFEDLADSIDQFGTFSSESAAAREEESGQDEWFDDSPASLEPDASLEDSDDSLDLIAPDSSASETAGEEASGPDELFDDSLDDEFSGTAVNSTSEESATGASSEQYAEDLLLADTWLDDADADDGDVYTGTGMEFLGDSSEPPPDPAVTDRVEFSVYSQKSIAPGAPFILDVWAFLREQSGDVAQLAASLGRETQRGRKSSVPVERGSVLSIQIEVPGLVVEDPVDTIFWDGEPANASFLIGVPESVQQAQVSGTVRISSEGIPIAKILFLLDISSQADTTYSDTRQDVVYPRTAFASYASDNRAEVLSRIQGMQKVAPDLDIFVDALSLRSGQDWLSKLQEHVPAKDVFYLFWSQSAARSEWVEREWRMALEKRGIDYIDPVPLQEPDFAPPPAELSSLHFNDARLAYIENEKRKNEIRQQAESSINQGEY